MLTLKNYINGKWVDAVSGKTSEFINPGTQEVLGTAAYGNDDDAKLAIESAKDSFYKTRQWRDMDAMMRSDTLLKIADELEARAEEFAKWDCLNGGKILSEATTDVDDAVHCFRYYAGLIRTPDGDIYNVNNGCGKMYSFTVHEPVGVCALITPWNYPLLMAAWKLAPALAAGNSVIFKPASYTPVTSYLLFEIFDKVGLPAGAANLVMGSGASVGQALSESHDVDMLSFTGSTVVGQGIAHAAVSNLKKVGLELGGKSPNVIFPDANIDEAVDWAIAGAFGGAGQVCAAGTRIIVHNDIHDEFMNKFVAATKKLTIGLPITDPDIGAIVSKSQLETVMSYIESGKEEGAVLRCGGNRYTDNGCENGFFVEPTIFDNCTRDMRIVREEIFGPVASVLTFETEEEAIEIANDTEYGLAGGVFTRDISRALRVISEVRAGITWINCYGPTFSEAPWGGYKMSGLGRDLGVHGLEEFQEIKQVNINLDSQPSK